MNIEFSWNGVDYAMSPLTIIQADDENKGKMLYEAIGMPKEQAEHIHNTHLTMQRRKDAYPPITDYIDGLVKGDQAQIDKYIEDCLAVKESFPKPTLDQ